MFLIFGFKRKAQRIASVFALCESCRTPAAQVVVRIRLFFSLFFVPIIPLGVSYRSTCTMCGRTVRVTKDAVTQLTRQASDPVATGQSPGAPMGALQPQPTVAPLPAFRAPSGPPPPPAFPPSPAFPPPPAPNGGSGPGTGPPSVGL